MPAVTWVCDILGACVSGGERAGIAQNGVSGGSLIREVNACELLEIHVLSQTETEPALRAEEDFFLNGWSGGGGRG